MHFNRKALVGTQSPLIKSKHTETSMISAPCMYAHKKQTAYETRLGDLSRQGEIVCDGMRSAGLPEKPQARRVESKEEEWFLQDHTKLMSLFFLCIYSNASIITHQIFDVHTWTLQVLLGHRLRTGTFLT
jgi:hypothetical protein